MAKESHIALFKGGTENWNRWRKKNLKERPDLRRANFSNADLRRVNLQGVMLSEADLSGANLSDAILSKAVLNKAILTRATLNQTLLIKAILGEANLTEACLEKANLSWANLREAIFIGANLKEADLRGASLRGVNLKGANLEGADLRGANLSWAQISEANLKGANLSGVDFSRTDLMEADLTSANLAYARLVNVNLKKANLTNCLVYGVSAWNLNLEDAVQSNLIITNKDEHTITVDNLEVAQFIYLILNNQKIRDFINTVTSKAVLILGRFTPERKIILDALREALRSRNYLPILFDFDKPPGRNLTETVSTLAHMSRFVIADVTDAKSIPQELQRIVPSLPSLPVQPLLLSSQYEYAMFKDFLDYPWVLIPYQYDSLEDLLFSLEERVIVPAVAKVQEIEERRKVLENNMTQ